MARPRLAAQRASQIDRTAFIKQRTSCLSLSLSLAPSLTHSLPALAVLVWHKRQDFNNSFPAADLQPNRDHGSSGCCCCFDRAAANFHVGHNLTSVRCAVVVATFCKFARRDCGLTLPIFFFLSLFLAFCFDLACHAICKESRHICNKLEANNQMSVRVLFSVRLSVRLSVSPSVQLSVCQSVSSAHIRDPLPNQS